MNLLGRRSTPEPIQPDDLPARRVAAARRCGAWTELDPVVLVPRDRYLVHASTDEVFQRYRGDAFSPAGALISDMTPLAFIVHDGDVVMLERQSQRWSELVCQRARAGTR
jgi:hypothetical protein